MYSFRVDKTGYPTSDRIHFQISCFSPLWFYTKSIGKNTYRSSVEGQAGHSLAVQAGDQHWQQGGANSRLDTTLHPIRLISCLTKVINLIIRSSLSLTTYITYWIVNFKSYTWVSVWFNLSRCLKIWSFIHSVFCLCNLSSYNLIAFDWRLYMQSCR